jgi:AcrR family transcriptional regulator
MDCFHRAGYQATGMEDIASAVGITASALYRHFRGKQELLGMAMLDSTDRLVAALTDTEAEGLEPLLRTLASFTLEHRSYSIVWYREIRNLSPLHKDQVQERHERVLATVERALRTARGDLAPADVRLLSCAVLAVLSSPSFHHGELPRERFDQLLQGMAETVCAAQLPLAEPIGLPQKSALVPVSRREALLGAAGPLFADRGYQAVSMEDIGAALGITRLGVYHYFPGKADLLAAVIHRTSEDRWATLTRDLAQSTTAPEALRRVVRSYARSSTVDHGTGALLLASELDHLSATDQEAARRSQIDYAAEWVALLQECRPDLKQAEARIISHAVLVMLSLLPRLPLYAHGSDLATPMAEIGLAVLQIPDAP